jgi:hypothetical protein
MDRIDRVHCEYLPLSNRSQQRGPSSAAAVRRREGGPPPEGDGVKWCFVGVAAALDGLVPAGTRALVVLRLVLGHFAGACSSSTTASPASRPARGRLRRARVLPLRPREESPAGLLPHAPDLRRGLAVRVRVRTGHAQ